MFRHVKLKDPLMQASLVLALLALLSLPVTIPDIPLCVLVAIFALGYQMGHFHGRLVNIRENRP